MIIVDTGVWSETVRAAPNPSVTIWVIEHSSDIAITSITVGELLYGVSVMAHGKRHDALSAQIERLIMGSAERTFSYDFHAAHQLAHIKLVRKNLGRKIVAPEDAMIAAAHNFSVATRNVEDFASNGSTSSTPGSTEFRSRHSIVRFLHTILRRMRADRLVSLVMLRQRGRLTAAQLATELEVSGREISRDIEPESPPKGVVSRWAYPAPDWPAPLCERD